MDRELIFPLQNPVLTPVGHHKLLFYWCMIYINVYMYSRVHKVWDHIENMSFSFSFELLKAKIQSNLFPEILKLSQRLSCTIYHVFRLLTHWNNNSRQVFSYILICKSPVIFLFMLVLYYFVAQSTSLPSWEEMPINMTHITKLISGISDIITELNAIKIIFIWSRTASGKQLNA